jgi:hypothetical protein
MIYLESSPALKDGWVEKLSSRIIYDEKLGLGEKT